MWYAQHLSAQIGKWRLKWQMISYVSECEQLVRKMLLVNPEKRYTMHQVCKHKWMTMSGTDEVFESLVEECRKTKVSPNCDFGVLISCCTFSIAGQEIQWFV